MAVGQRFWKPQEEDVVVETEQKEETVVAAAEKQTGAAPVKKAEENVKTETAKKPLTKEEEAAQKQAELVKAGETAKKEAEAEVKEIPVERKPVVSSSTTPRVGVPVTKALSPAENNGAGPAISQNLEASLTEAFKKRKNIYNKDIEVESDSVRITFYDNGDIDGDTISVFLNGAPVLANQMITDRGTNIYVKLDSMKTSNEISMFAQNLGKYPPNTALMVVTDGNTRYEVYLSSSLSQNAAVRLVRKKKVNDPHRLKLK
jgi:hypothetical protein